MTLANIRTADAAGMPVAIDGLTEERVRASILRILAANDLCAIATVGHGNSAHVNTAYYCYSQDLELYFLSHPASLHGRNLRANPAAAAAIFSPAQRWGGQDVGLQLFGTCAEAVENETWAADALYAKRFEGYASWKQTVPPDAVARAYRFFRFSTGALKLLDEQEFGPAIFVSASVGPRR